MGTPRTIEGIEEEAARLGINPEVATAFLIAESGGRAFGKLGRVLLRFELHHFSRLARGWKHQFKLTKGYSHRGHKMLVHGKWRFIHVDRQDREHAAFALACLIDEDAACTSTSFGLGQIMGSNHRIAGYNSAAAMMEDFQRSEAAQVAGFFRFLEKEQITAKLAAGDVRGAIARYNGPANVDGYMAKYERALGAARA